MAASPHTVAAALGPDVRDEISGVPDADHVVAPATLDAAAAVLRTASEHGMRVVVWGSGSHQGIGYPVAADLVVSTHRLNRIVDWQPEDLTIVVEAGVTVDQLETHLEDRNQSAVLPETPGTGTVGGVVATGTSAWRRLRYGPTRDRILEVVMITGDGRTVTGGGRVVKNVTGYDVPRLATGSLGSLGLIGQVCLKLWPVARHSGTIAVADAAEARQVAYRPLAVLQSESSALVYVAGTAEEVAGQAADLGSVAVPGLAWPAPLTSKWQLALRVPAAETAAAVAEMRALLPTARFLAAHGVGDITIASGDLDLAATAELRRSAEARQGSLVVLARPEGDIELDPWGTPPLSLPLQRRIKAAFDPAGVMAPGRLPGRL